MSGVRLGRSLVVSFRHRLRPLPVDAALAALLWGLDVVLFLDPSRSTGVFGGSAALWYAAAGFVLLLWRRRLPALVLAGMVAHSLLAWLLSHGYVPTLGVWLALYTVAAAARWRVAAAGFGLALLSGAANVADIVQSQPAGNELRGLVVSSAGLLLFNSCVFGAGRWVRWTIRHKELVAQRAAMEAVLAERRRIARDLHDVAAHAVTLMVLQAGGAARHVRTDPARAEVALAQVDVLGQQAIRELQQLLGMLATDDDDAGAPVSVLDVDRMIARATTEELPIRLTVVGEPVSLDAGIDICLGRIVQEALTNAVRYADRHTPVDLTMSWLGGQLEIAVRNGYLKAIRGGRHSLGQGVIGMRERARAIGAELSIGPGPDGTFLVTVRVPLPGSLLGGPRAPAPALSARRGMQS